MDISNLPRVTSPEIYELQRNTKHYHKDGIFSEQIFGPEMDYTCQCGIFKQDNSRCPKCGVAYIKSTRGTQQAIIELPFDIINPQILYLVNKYDSSYMSKMESYKHEVVDELFNFLDDVANDNLGDYKKSIKLTTLKKYVDKYPSWVKKRHILVLPASLRPIAGGKSSFTTDSVNHYYQKILEHIDQYSKETIKRDSYHQSAIMKTFYKFYIEEVIEKISQKDGHIRKRIFGKRVDFSGRTVAAIDCSLTLDQIKLPYAILVKIYEPLIHYYYESKIRSMNEMRDYTVKGILNPKLKETIDRIAVRIPVIINRQPTLHRQSMRAYNVIPTLNNTLHVNPFIVEGFNLDFDGDQMAIYAPLLSEEIEEFKTKFINHKNQIQPGTLRFGSVHQFAYPVYMMTLEEPNPDKIMFTLDELDINNLTDYISHSAKYNDTVKILQQGEYKITTVGRAVVSYYLDTWIDRKLNKGAFNEIVTDKLLQIYHDKGTVQYDDLAFIDNLLQQHLIYYPMSISIRDFNDIKNSEEFVSKHDELVNSTSTARAKYLAENLTEVVKGSMHYIPNITNIISSGSKGNFGSINQMVVNKGYVMTPQKKVVPYYIKRSLLSGLSSKDMYVMSFGTRKGSLDRSVSTAQTGYLMRKMIFALQDLEYDQTCDDCGTTTYMKLDCLIESDVKAYMFKHISLDPEFKTYETLLPSNKSKYIGKEVYLSSPIHCKNPQICKKCYGDYAKIFDSKMIGIIAAQALGERCTQLMMRTFHTGGVAENVKDFINTNYFDIDGENLVSKKSIKIEAIETNLSDKDIFVDNKLLDDVYMIEAVNSDELVIPKNCILKYGISNKCTIPKGAIVATLPEASGGSVISVVDYIIEMIEKPKLDTWEELYDILFKGFYRTEGIISLHIELMISQMVRRVDNSKELWRIRKEGSYQLLSIKKIPNDRNVLSLGFQYFHKNLLEGLIDDGISKLPYKLKDSIMEQVIKGVTKESLGIKGSK